MLSSQVSKETITHIREDYLKKIAAFCNSEGFVVDKMPGNFKYLG